MINSNLSYLIPIWGPSASRYDLDRLQVAQNRAIRRLFSSDYHGLSLSTNQIRLKYRILNIKQMIGYYSSIMMFKIDKKLMKTNFKINRNNRHGHMTRFRNCPQTIAHRSWLGGKSIYNSCMRLYLESCVLTTNNRNINCFKRSLKDKLLGN